MLNVHVAKQCQLKERNVIKLILWGCVVQAFVLLGHLRRKAQVHFQSTLTAVVIVIMITFYCAYRVVNRSKWYGYSKHAPCHASAFNHTSFSEPLQHRGIYSKDFISFQRSSAAILMTFPYPVRKLCSCALYRKVSVYFPLHRALHRSAFKGLLYSHMQIMYSL